MASVGVLDSVGGIMYKAGVPESIWGPIMDIESGGDPTASQVNRNESSIGLFALNQKGGLGAGYTVAQLQDVTTNATIASKAMGPVYAQGVSQGLTGLDLLRYVAYGSGWPTSAGVGSLKTSPVVQAYDVKLQGEYNAGEGGGGMTVASGAGGTLSGVTSGLNALTESVEGMTQGQKYALLGLGAVVALYGLTR